MAEDARPVFNEERLLLERLLKKKTPPLSIWRESNRYFFGGKSAEISRSALASADCDFLKAQVEKAREENSVEADARFEESARKFTRANEARLEELCDEAAEFVKKEAAEYPRENIVVSFSGGKDSTVTADIVEKALGDASLVHIFGDTTLEFPSTYEYAKRWRAAHPRAIFEVARNDEQDFMKVCDDIGPPARMMRWCCSMFKTGPITRALNALYRDENVLTFYGIRRAESASRSKYNRVENSSASVKIQKQKVASPIIDWKDADVWLYILAKGLDFNDVYRFGYDRVGCWRCPNNSARSEFLTRVFMGARFKKWRDFLVEFARRIGKPDAEEYVDSGAWKARQGGNGLARAEDVKIKFTNCSSEESAKNYRLVRPLDDELLGMFTPFGVVSKTLGRELLRETLVLDAKTNVPIISLQPFKVDGFEFAVKAKTMNVESRDELQRMIACQIRKFNACRKCLKCEAICKAGAIKISDAGYFIDAQKCVRCKMCVKSAAIENGCMMAKYLRVKAFS